MQTIDHLIQAKWIITCEDQNKILENHALAIQGDKILAILPVEEAKKQYQAKQVHDYGSHAVIPGLINCHTHISMNFLRGLADDLELIDWLNNHIWPAEGKWVDHDFVYDASLLAMGEMIKGGTTCFNDMYFFMGATAEAAEQTGIRAHIGMTIIGVPTAWAETTEEYFTKAVAFYDQYKNHPRIKPTLAPHSTYTVSAEELKRAHELAKQYQLQMNIHLQEAPSEVEQSIEHHKAAPLKRLDEMGLVSPQLIAVHMTQISDSDFDILKKTKPHIVHCPESNMKLMSGACPVDKLLKMGINVALGTDGAASNNDLDMFSEMRTAALLGKMTAKDPKAVNAETALKMATINGAKALGIDHITGSLTPGKSADFVAINLDQIETQPLYHVVSQIVYAASRFQVTDTWVCGKQLLKNRELQTVDEKILLNKAQNWGNRIKN